MSFDPTERTGGLRLMTLAQLAQAGPWQLELAHDRPEHLLVWITRGQGLGLVNGGRAGLGTHNALFFPARTLMSLELGRQSFGQALAIPDDGRIALPREVQHLRIRDVGAQGELTGLLDALGREQSGGRPLHHDAMHAYGELVAIWMRRQMPETPPEAATLTAARRLVLAYCDRIVRHHGDGGGVTGHADALDVTPTHLTRVCRAQTGKTAATLLNERLQYAARLLLRETRAPVRDIARHLGFSSPATFTRFIRQQTGATPSQLRRAGRTGP